MNAPFRLLPKWCSNPEGRELIAEVLAERPECLFVYRDRWTHQKMPKFRGENARKLRSLWSEAVDRAMLLSDRELYAILHTQEHPDDLVERLLRNPEIVQLEARPLGDGRYGVGG